MSILPVSIIEQRLILATTPQQTRELEEVSAAARAYYYEQRNYEAMVEATRLYLLARRKTTELVAGERNMDVTLADFGFTRMQWHRRQDELNLEMDKINEYFDECIAKGWNPSIAGVLRWGHDEQHEPVVICTCPMCGNEHRK